MPAPKKRRRPNQDVIYAISMQRISDRVQVDADNEKLQVIWWGDRDKPAVIIASRADMKMLARRINQCLQETRYKAKELT